MGIAEDLIIIILVGLVAGLIAHKLKIPAIIGYILAGIIIGPFTGGLTVSNIKEIELLAEIGVALLLFSIGLDLSFRELKAVKGVALIGGPLQILLLIGLGPLIGSFLDLELKNSLILGMVISLSSTMVVLKMLMAQGAMGTLSSKVMIGILIVQDLAAIPLMLLIPNLDSLEGNLSSLGFILLKAMLILAVIIVVGLRLIPWFLKHVARLNSRELFLITITAIGLGVGLLTHMVGLSLAFGAFIAGMVMSESDYSHQALNDIVPLRDIFGLVFFTSIGMLLNPHYLYANLGIILTLVAIIVVLKIVIFTSLGYIFKYGNIVPLAMGLGMAQIGEFSFVLARTGLKSGIISNDFYTMLLSVSIITMILSPFLSLAVNPLFQLKKKLFSLKVIETKNLSKNQLHNHIVIAGGGRVGFRVASVFSELNYPFILIEQDFRRFENSKKAGFPTIFGDANTESVLQVTNLKEAEIIIITIPSMIDAKQIIRAALHANPDIKIIVRADDLTDFAALEKLAVHEVVQPEFEASLEVVRQTLFLRDEPLSKIHEITDSIRNIHTFKAETIRNSVLKKLDKTPFLLELSWLEITDNCILKNQSIFESKIRTQTGVSVVSILRDKELLVNPDASEKFMPGDFIAVIGESEDKKLFKKLFFKNKV